jgi:hypothetical protein
VKGRYGPTTRRLALDEMEARELVTGAASAILRPLEPQPSAVMPGVHVQDYDFPQPYKQDDLLCCREDWTSIANGKTPWGVEIHYKADGTDLSNWADRERARVIIPDPPNHADCYRPLEFGPWHRAILMPEWAARIYRIVERIIVVDLIAPAEIGRCGRRGFGHLPRWCWLIEVRRLRR